MLQHRHEKPFEEWTKVDWDAEYQKRTMLFVLYEAILKEESPDGELIFETAADQERYEKYKRRHEEFLIIHRNAVRVSCGKPPGDTPHPTTS